ncbi:MAG: DNA primase [Ardenticatenaceae bacterium]|nr:DNA primase [Ardenticatenaceae bacterium]
MSVTEEIKSRLDIVDVVSETVNLRKSGRSYAGFCPFHSNTRTPAFYVFPETQTWHCFGACAEGGDIFSYVMKREGMDFKEALRVLAQKAGVSLEEARPVDKAQKAAEDRLGDLLAAAAEYFHQLLLHAPQAEAARQYVARRQLDPETQAHFQIGFALDSWDQCRTHFTAQGYTDDDLLDAGLLSENPDKGTRYDRFRNRLMIPIRDGNGRIVGFGARTLDPDGVPKYLNSPQTQLFDKSNLLFGLDGAKRSIREARQAVIVEGYMDVMQAWQAGFRNVVAQMGTALTQEQLGQLKRLTKQFVLALDADAAGAKATMRSLQVARETLDRELDVRFEAHNLVRYEGRLQADIRIVTLPEGNDPDKIIREDPTQWPKLLAKARPVVEYVIAVLTQDLDLGNAKAKTAVAQQIIPLIEDIQDPVERDHYWQRLAHALRVDERALRQARRPERKRPPAEHAYAPRTVPPPPEPPAEGELRETAVLGARFAGIKKKEDFFLSQVLHYPKALADVNQVLGQSDQPTVGLADFTATEDRALWAYILQWSSRGSFVTIQDLCDSLEYPLLDRVQKLQTLAPTLDANLDRLTDQLVLAVLDWRIEKARQLRTDLQRFVAEAKQQGDLDSYQEYLVRLQELSVTKLRLDQAKDAMSATSRRRAEDAALGRF